MSDRNTNKTIVLMAILRNAGRRESRERERGGRKRKRREKEKGEGERERGGRKRACKKQILRRLPGEIEIER